MKTSLNFLVLFCASLWLGLLATPVRADILYVGNSDFNRIDKFDSSGLDTVFANSGLNVPLGLAYDRAGNLYVSNQSTNLIEKFTPGGVGSVFASNPSEGAPTLYGPWGLAFDGAGNLFVANPGNSTIVRIAPNGVASLFASLGDRPVGLAFDRAGNLFVSLYLGGGILKFTPAGASSVFANGDFSGGLAFDRAGHLFASNQNGDAIYKFTPNGVGTVFASGLGGPRSLAFDRAGNLYTANAQNKVYQITSAGVASVFIGSGLSSPQDLAFTDDQGVPLTLPPQLDPTGAKPFGWGINVSGAIGDGTTAQHSTAVATDVTGVLAGKTVVAISAGFSHTLALASDGKIYAWGANGDGQLGDGTTTEHHSPVAVDMGGALEGKTVIAIAAGSYHSVALTSEGKVYAWGRNVFGQLGDGTGTPRLTPVAVDMTGVLAGKTVTAISAGSFFTVALTSQGKVYGWGVGSQGQLGDGAGAGSASPVAADASGALAGKTVTAITTGQAHTVALTSEGKVYAWGDNGEGELGDGTTTQRNSPVAVDASGVLAGQFVTAISAGTVYTLALTSDGKIDGWGENFAGQLGDGTATQRNSPVATDVSGALEGKVITAIAGGESNTLALDSDGKIYAWGSNGAGQLGDGTTTEHHSPVTVDMSGALAGRTVIAINTAGADSFALATPPSGAPEIAIEQPAGTDLTAGASFISFGSVNLGSSSAAKVFTIKNTGTANLTVGLINTDGSNFGDFSVDTTATAASVAPGDSTTFSVTFTPSAAGPRNATLHVANDDADENTFDLTLTGTGIDPATLVAAVDDAVTTTTGATRLYPLANDRSPTGAALSITGVSEPTVTIVGRTLVVPEGFTGTFTYTATDGVSNSTATVTVTAGPPAATPRTYSGLLTDSAGHLAGSAKVTVSPRGYASAQVRLATGAASGKFSFPTGHTTGTGTTTQGSVAITLNANETLDLSLAAAAGTVTGTLRASPLATTAIEYHVALASIDPAIPGGGLAVARVKSSGLVNVLGTLPDGRPFSASSMVGDNGTISFFTAETKGVLPPGILGGEFVAANLTATDSTGELIWSKPAQSQGAKGLHLGGVNTVLTANGSLYSGVIPLAGPGTLLLSGGNLAAEEGHSVTVTNGTPTVPTGSLKNWGGVKASIGRFRARVVVPGIQRPVSGSGIYLPKSNTAWGFFPGTTVGGRIELIGPQGR